MADGLLSNVLGAIDRKKQEVKAGLGLLANNPQEWAAQATARYFPTKEEERQFRMVKEMGGDITQTPYYQKVFDLAQFQGSLKPLSKTQFQVANEVAQKNATEMLGLPPDNTAMDRAKALGFDTSAYHGTNKDVSKIDLNMAGSKTGNPNAHLGFFSTPNVQEASRYASDFGGVKGGNVMPLMIRRGNSYPISYKEMNDISMGIFNAPGSTPKERYLSASNWAKDKRQQLLSEGYDTASFREGMPVEEIISLKPETVRSRFAAFDPARVNESDLLAAGIPIGLLGSTQVELPKKQEKKPKK
jgi:hypothetical protein